MAVHISVGGNEVSGEGFLVAPQGTNYEAEIALWTDAGTTSVTLQADAAHNVANLVFSNPGPINISTTPTFVTVHAQAQSNSRGDTTIQVIEGANSPINFTITCISHPVVHFKGRFEARFATDTGRPYLNPTYPVEPGTATVLVVPPGRTWALEGEPDFCPGSPVPQNLEDTGMGRNLRLNNPAALRGPVGMNVGEVRPVVSTVDHITGETAMNPNEKFTTGDPLIGLPVNFGPDTYLAGNNDSSDTPGAPAPEEYYWAGREPLALFEINIGNTFTPPAVYFRGKSQVSGFTHKAASANEKTRATDSRPITPPSGIGSATVDDFAAFGLGNQQTYSNDRMDVLLAAYLAPGVTAGASTVRRNLVRRICHLLPRVSAAKAAFVTPQAVAPDVFSSRTGSLSVDWTGKETFTGKVDASLHAWPGNGSPGLSSVVAYMTEFFAFDIEWNAFAFHTDENCGHHIGKLGGVLSMTGNHIGDPHVHTVNGKAYDFQAVGEFTLLRDGNRMEIQARQAPVATANPIQDDYSGLTACVSVNTAIAVRVGSHRISLQPGREGKLLQFYVDGKPANFPREGLDLGAHRVTAFAASGETAIRVDFADGTVVTITPRQWLVWLLDVSVSHTRATEGIMGIVPKDSWLPRLRNGANLGPKPAAPHDRYVALYKTFADSWRVTDKTSLFTYAPGTSTKTFTDPDWPAEHAPCNMKPEFQIPGVPVLQGMPIKRAEAICKIVTDKELHKNCVFDVATTGDETFVKGYVHAHEHRLYATSVRIGCHEAVHVSRSVEPTGAAAAKRDPRVLVWAMVLPLTPGRPIPTGTVTFFIDGVPMNRPVPVDDRGWAGVDVGSLKPGDHLIRATYSGGGKFDYYTSSSANQMCSIGPDGEVKPHDADHAPR